MLQCSSCDAKQSEGRFCGNCGGPLVEVSSKEESIQKDSLPDNQPIHQEQHGEYEQAKEEVAATDSPSVTDSASSNDTMDQVVGVSKDFWAYFTEYIREPSRIFAKKESEFKNGIISMSIIAILIGLTLAKLTGPLREEMRYYAAMNSSVPTFFSVFLTALLFIIFATVVTIILLFLINKLFGPDYNIKEITSVFGAHMVPVIILAVLSLILVLVESNIAGTFLTLITIGSIITTVPVYLISSLLTKRPKGIDPFYGYALYLVSVGISFAILSTIFIDSTIGNLLKNIQSW